MPPTGTNRSTNIVLVVIAATFVALSFALLVVPTSELARRVVPDDGLFYLVLARNAANGHWSSFDSFELTNGYHPLWFVVLAALAKAKAVSGSVAFFKAALVLCAALYGASAWLLHRIVRRAVDPAAAALAAACFTLLFVPTGWYLTEAALATFLAALFLLTATRNDVVLPRTQVLLGVLGGTAVLARLDAIFVVIPVLIAVSPSRLWSDRGLALGAFGALLVPYLSLNLLLHGHLTPISGALKSSFPYPTVTNLPLSPGRWLRILVPLALAGGSLGVLMTTRQRHRVPIRDTAMAASIGVLLFGGYELLFQKDAQAGLWSWHFAVPTYAGLFCASVAGATTVTSQRTIAIVSLAVVTMSGVLLERRLTAPSSADASLSNMYAAAAWVRTHVPPKTRIAATDPGIVAYFGERSTVNLDGLINNFDYQHALRNHGLATYLRERGIAFVCVKNRRVPQHYGRFDVYFAAQLFEGEGDTLRFSRSDEAFRTADGDVVIWRLATDRLD